jgi:hypothetical protein
MKVEVKQGSDGKRVVKTLPKRLKEKMAKDQLEQKHTGKQHQEPKKRRQGIVPKSGDKPGVEKLKPKLTAKINGNGLAVSKSVPRVEGRLGTTYPKTEVAADGGAIVELGRALQWRSGKESWNEARVAEEPNAAQGWLFIEAAPVY